MNRRLRSLLVLGLLVLLVVALAGCNRERPAVTNDKGTPAPGRGTVAAPTGSVTPLATIGGESRNAQPATSTAPSPQSGQSTTVVPQTSGATSSSGSFNYTVATGDNLAAIAARFGTTVDAIARLNSITDPNAITPGQVLKIPGTAPAGGAAAASTTSGAGSGESGTYTVQPGDTLGRIAQRFNTTTAELVRLNNLANPDQIKVGQKLVVPGGTRSTTSGGQTTTTGQGRTHVVARGETLGTIAKQYGVTVKQIQAANNLANPDRIYVGQKLIIP